MTAAKLIIATGLAVSLASLVQAELRPRMDSALEHGDPLGQHYYDLEIEWLQDKKSNCAHDAGVVERILDHRDRGGSLGELLLSNSEERYYLKIAVSHWNDKGSAQDTATGLYRYCIEKGTYWSPLAPLNRKTG